MSKLNPLPWSIDEYASVMDANGKMVFANGFASAMSSGDRQDQAKANSCFIALAVNNHADLMAALREIVEQTTPFQNEAHGIAPFIHRIAAAAIAKAEGK